MWTQHVREEVRDVANDGSVRRVQEGLVTVDANALAATVREFRPSNPLGSCWCCGSRPVTWGRR